MKQTKIKLLCVDDWFIYFSIDQLVWQISFEGDFSINEKNALNYIKNHFTKMTKVIDWDTDLQMKESDFR